MAGRGGDDGGPARGWAGLAVPWGRWHAEHAALTRAGTAAIVAAAGIGPGMRVLDLASGTGEPALTIARIVGPGGAVTATDVASAMLATVVGEARARGLGNLAVCAADAQELPFPDAAFDAVTCRLGIMFFADAARSLRAARRVLRPGGRAAYLAWGPFAQPFFATFDGVIGRRLGFAPGEGEPPDAPGLFRYAVPGRLAAALAAAGFAGVEETAPTLPWRWVGAVEEYVARRRAFAPPFETGIAALPRDEQARLWAAVRAALREYEDGEGGLTFPARVTIAAGAA